MKIATTTSTEQELQQIKIELQKESDELNKALDSLTLKQQFLAATNIFMILKNEFLEKNHNVTISYFYDTSQDAISFQKILINDGENDIKPFILSKLYMESIIFLENIEENLTNSKNSKFSFFNDDNGRHIFLEKIMGNDYKLWQKLCLEQQLSETKSIRKQKI